MILCCKPIFIIPARRIVNVILARECQLSSPSLSLLIRSCMFCKLKSSVSIVDNSPSFRRILYSAPYHSDHLKGTLLERNEKIYSENYQIRHYSNEADEKKEPEKKLSLFQKFKNMYKEYWYVLVPVHLLTSSIWFGSFYYLAKSGVDIVALLQWLDVGESLVQKLQKGNGTFGYLAVASAMYKIVTPARYAVTLGGTTVSIKYLKDWGYIKPIPPKEKIKEIIDEKRDLLRKRGSRFSNKDKTGKLDES